MSWGYKHSCTSFAQDMQNNRVLIKEDKCNERKVYRSYIGEDFSTITITLHDNRKNDFPNMVIIKSCCLLKSYNLGIKKTLKEMYEFIEEKLIELNLISKL